MNHTILGLLLICLSVSLAWAQPSLRAAVPVGLPKPLLISEDNKMTGILPEYIEAVAEVLGRKHTLLPIAHHRVLGYFEKGRIDFLCYAHPDWTPYRDQVHWSLPLFLKKEVLLGSAPLPKALESLKGKTVGTVVGHTYPNLEDLFKRKSLVREDGPSEEANLQKLLSKRISYVVTDEIFLDYFKIAHPDVEHGRERLSLQVYPISCTINPKGAANKQDLNKAIQKLKASKKLEGLFKKYGVVLREP